MGKEALAMIPFTTRFPEIGPRETRTIVFPDDGSFPRGQYAFLESYCEEEGCDCRCVLLTVVEESTPGKIWATISFGWDLPTTSAARAMLDELGATAAGAVLDPICPQSEHAAEFLDLFKWMITQDPAYVKRLKRHYEMFKAFSSTKTTSSQIAHSETRAKRPNPELLKKRMNSR
jgi:hypothetical protein